MCMSTAIEEERKIEISRDFKEEVVEPVLKVQHEKMAASQ